MIDTVKPPENGAKGEIIIRLYEGLGGRGIARLVSDKIEITKAEQCNLLEDVIGQFDCEKGGVKLPFQPFQIITMKIHFTLLK